MKKNAAPVIDRPEPPLGGMTPAMLEEVVNTSLIPENPVPEDTSLQALDDIDIDTEDFQRSMDRISREIKTAPAAKATDAEVFVISTLETLYQQKKDAEETRDKFQQQLTEVTESIRQMIVKRQHLRNEIGQCERVIDSLKLSILGLDLT